MQATTELQSRTTTIRTEVRKYGPVFTYCVRLVAGVGQVAGTSRGFAFSYDAAARRALDDAARLGSYADSLR